MTRNGESGRHDGPNFKFDCNRIGYKRRKYATNVATDK